MIKKALKKGEYFLSKNCLILLFSILFMVILVAGCNNYPSSLHPSEMLIYKFSVLKGQKVKGYQISKNVTDKEKVSTVWNIIKNMKEDKKFKSPMNLQPTRLCFDFTSSQKPKFDCFDINEQGYNLVLTEIMGDSSGRHFKLSKSSSEKIKKIYQ